MTEHKRQAGDAGAVTIAPDIEVTEEMIEAGLPWLNGFWRERDCEEDALRDIYIAMHQASMRC